jgi:hypothetical protein
MNIARYAGFDPLRGVRPAFVSAATLLLVFGCKQNAADKHDPFDSAGMHSESIDRLKQYQVTHGDRRQILIAGRAGMSEQRCVKLVEIARAPPRFRRARYPR